MHNDRCWPAESRIGRFRVTRTIGRGSQGSVLEAVDPKLRRRVAIKLLGADTDEHAHRELMAEGQTIGLLQHPNVVTLYEVGHQGHLPYLVLEHVDGGSLRELLDTAGPLDPTDAVVLMSQILAGVAYAHERGVVHLDLSPANILIAPGNIPKVTDFGLAGVERQPGSGVLAGTLRYMSPEAFAAGRLGPHSDVFALGAIFWEMLTGAPRFDGENRALLVYDILKGPVVLPSQRAPGLAPPIDRVVERALRRVVAERYPNARAMKDELDAYRLPRASDDANEHHSTVDFLVRRMGYRKGFLALSRNVGDVMDLTSDRSNASASRLTNAIAKDVTLAQRVLTTANSAYYGNGEITTLSRAIVLLGMKQTRMCLTSALLEGRLDAGSPEVRNALLGSFFGGAAAKALAQAAGLARREDAFMCGMFHDLGRLLTIHYLPEEYEEILAAARDECIDPLTASRRILGVAFHELGAGVARSWKFPSTIIDAMRPLPRNPNRVPANEAERLRWCAALANTLVRAAQHEDAERRAEAAGDVANRAEQGLGIGQAALATAVAEAAELARRYACLTGDFAGQEALLGGFDAVAAALDPDLGAETVIDDPPLVLAAG